jgi:hypothetical protein
LKEENNMPHETTQYYTLSGWQTVTLYTESEMAEALDLSISELRDALEGGKYGLSYHSHPLATYNREYEFLRSSYEKNIEIWNCIKAGGHFLEFSRYYDEKQGKKVFTCKQCGYEKYESPQWR